MYPDRIPEPVRRDPARAAECAVYEALLDTLPQDYRVFGWVAWLALNERSGARDGEADFVIAHPEHGLLVLEVKGGAIGFDAGTGAWSTRDAAGREHRLRESPFEQARRHRYDLARKLEESRGGSRDGATFGWAVAFPDCAAPPEDLGLDARREMLLCRPDLGRIDERVAAIFRAWRGAEPSRGPLGAAGLEHVTRLLARSFQLRMPLGRVLEDDARRLIELSETQYHVLDGLARNRRVIVTGGAGTGKTLLALEKAQRLARDDGFRTLLTCFNRPLSEYLRESAGDVPGLVVESFHDLCTRLGREAGLDVTVPRDEAARLAFYRQELPARLVEALAQRPERFDAIVLDEGQDFGETDRAAIELCLAERDRSVLYVFQDEAQGIYRDASPWPEAGMTTYVLTENRRNTRAIHEVLGRLAGGTRTRPLGPPGQPPEYVAVPGGREQGRALSRVLHRLVHEQGIPPGTIAVLASSRSGEPPVVEDGRIGAFEVTTRHDDGTDRVLFESITRFKGLERDVVVLVRLDPVDFVEYGPLLYVGASRARALLVVIGDEDVLRRFRDGAGAPAPGAP